MDTILVVLGGIGLLIIGWAVGYFHCLYNMVKVRMYSTTISSSNTNVSDFQFSVLSVEAHGEQFYAYDPKGNFVAQGNNIQHLAATCLEVAKINRAVFAFSNKIGYFIDGKVYNA
jgi:hypothetical protein